jgi:hypothetical protein
MAEIGPEGDGEDDGGVFATLAAALAAMMPRRRVHQINVAAVHEIDPAPHQADGAVPQIVRFPAGTGGNAGRAEEPLRDAAICLTREPAIERSEREEKPPASLCSKAPRRRPLLSARCESPHAKRSINACREVRGKRDDDGGWGVDLCSSRKQQGKTAVSVVDEQVVSASAATLECRDDPETAGVAEYLGGGSDHDHAGIIIRQPDEPGFTGGKIWLDGETATPNAEQAPRRGHLLVSSRERYPDNRGGNRDCGAGIPMQSRRDGAGSHTNSGPKSANRMPTASLVSPKQIAAPDMLSRDGRALLAIAAEYSRGESRKKQRLISKCDHASAEDAPAGQLEHEYQVRMKRYSGQSAPPPRSRC